MAGNINKENFFDRFCSDVSISAFRFLHSKQKFRIRLLFTFVVLFMVGMTIYQCYKQIALFTKYPIAVVVTESDGKNDVMPAIVICPPSQFRYSQAFFRYSPSASLFDPKLYAVADFWDLNNLEINRETATAKFQKKNISFTTAQLNNTIQQLELIYEALNNSENAPFESIRRNLAELSAFLKDTFPLLASHLSATEPLPEGIILLNRTKYINAQYYDYFRAANMQYDQCTKLTDIGAWEDNIADIIRCRINMFEYSATNPNILWKLKVLVEMYPRIVNLARTSQTDIILDCKWFNKGCNITDVWTPKGRCFRVGPLNEEDAFVTKLGSDAAVNVLIDAIKYEFPEHKSEVYFYQQRDTEFPLYSGSITIRPGKISDLIINQKRYNLRASQTCGTLPLRKFSAYTKEKCIWEKRTEFIAEKCNCSSDLTIDFLSETEKEMAKMKKDDEYQPPPNTFCSFVETYFCVPNAIPDDYFCPENCEEQSYEIDVAYNQIDGKQTYSRVPKATAKEISSNLGTLSNNGGVFPTAPGSDQLQSILARLFAFQMKLIRLFWWRSDEPHYRAWFADNNFPHNESTFLSYFDGFEDSLMPCTPKDFNDSHFAVPNAILIQFFKIINKTIVHYYKLHDTWKTDYIFEVLLVYEEWLTMQLNLIKKNNQSYAEMEYRILDKALYNIQHLLECDLINDPECFKYNAIKRNGKEYEGLENAFTDTTLSKLWTLDWVAEIEQTLNDYNLDNSPAAELLRMINALNYPVDISSPSIWHKPLTIYLNWFNQEVDFEEGHSIAAAFSQDANALDVATVSSVYVIDSAPRAALKEVLLKVSLALNEASEHIAALHSLAYKLGYPSESTEEEDIYSFRRYSTFLSILYKDNSSKELLNNIYSCTDHWEYESPANDLESLLWDSDDDTVQLSPDGTHTMWYQDFINLIDYVLYVYQDGRSYHETSLAEINVFYRSFRQRKVEEELAYSFWSLLSDVGGALGLWLGATVVTIFELLLIGLSPGVLQRSENSIDQPTIAVPFEQQNDAIESEPVISKPKEISIMSLNSHSRRSTALMA